MHNVKINRPCKKKGAILEVRKISFDCHDK